MFGFLRADDGAPESGTGTAAENIEKIKPETDGVREVVADKGYHSNELLKDLRVLGIRTYISEPARGRRHWQDDPVARQAVYAKSTADSRNARPTAVASTG